LEERRCGAATDAERIEHGADAAWRWVCARLTLAAFGR
jgi:hypothetical protein